MKKKGMRRIASLLLAIGMIMTGISAAAAENQDDPDDSPQFTIIEHPLDESKYPHECDPRLRHFSGQPHYHFIGNLRRTTASIIQPMTAYVYNNYAQNPPYPTVSIAVGKTTTVSETVEIGANFDLSAAIEGIGTTYGASVKKRWVDPILIK